jgi:hypothetical protein
MKKERRVASMIIAGTWSGVAGEDAAGLWAPDDTTNTFLVDVNARISTIRGNTGLKPNVLMMDFDTFQKVKELGDILDRIKYVQRGIVTAEMIAALLNIDEVLVGSAIYSTAKEKKDGTDFTASNVWEKNAGKGSAFLFYRPRAVGLKTPSAGYQARVAYENGQPRRTTMWREPAEHQDVYEVAEETDIVQTGSDLGFLWYDTIVT